MRWSAGALVDALVGMDDRLRLEQRTKRYRHVGRDPRPGLGGGEPSDRSGMELIRVLRDTYVDSVVLMRLSKDVGLDALEVLHTRVLPVVNTGIAHRQPGVGQIGAGLVKPPVEAFLGAVEGLAEAMDR
jgi:hypothetical protein